jgi:hypothetical protein
LPWRPALRERHCAPTKPIDSRLRYALIPVAFKLRKVMSDSLYLNAMYYLSLGTLPRLHAPRTFNEMINHRKLYDRNPAFVVTSDKYAVRDYVAARVGAGYLIPLIAHETNPREIDFASLPRAFAVKLNHGSGLNVLVTDKEAVNWQEILLKLQRWIRFPTTRRIANGRISRSRRASSSRRSCRIAADICRTTTSSTSSAAKSASSRCITTASASSASISSTSAIAW